MANKKPLQVDLNEFVKGVQKTLKEGTQGKITEINKITNTAFFKEKGLYDEKMGVAITVKVINTETEFTQWFNLPQPNGFSQSNLGLFVKKYGVAPSVGMTIDVSIDENGFYRIA